MVNIITLLVISPYIKSIIKKIFFCSLISKNKAFNYYLVFLSLF